MVSWVLPETVLDSLVVLVSVKVDRCARGKPLVLTLVSQALVELDLSREPFALLLMRMGKTRHVMSCGPWMKGRPFLLLRWMSAGSCVSTLLSCPLRVPLWLWHSIKGLRPPWTERMDVGCQLALIWFQL